MSIIKQYHADTDTTYVYESTSYWDAEKKQSRSKRKLLGKLDPVTGEIIPTGTRGRKKKEAVEGNASSASLNDQKIQELTLELSLKKNRIAELEKENQSLKNQLEHIIQELKSVLSRCESIAD